MNYNQAIKNLNRSLTKRNPKTFNKSWVRNCVRKSHDFLIENIKTELGDTDWDKIVRSLDHDHQKLWLKGVKCKKEVAQYEDEGEINIVLNKYKDKLYTFLIHSGDDDKIICDEISIRLVRIAQKGNLLAKQKAMSFINLLINYWIDNRNLQAWRGYDDLIEENIDRCIRRYRYSGSFIVYLRRTFEYAGRGLKPLEAFSLDEYSPITERRRSDSLVYNPETGGASFYLFNK